MELVIEYVENDRSAKTICEKCGSELSSVNKGGIRKCKTCGNHTDRWGENVSLNELCYCRNCGETFMKRYSKVASNNELCSCPECSTIHNNDGLIVSRSQLVRCEHCNEYFIHDNYLAKLYKCPPIDSSCKCPACNHFLDKQGNVVDNGKMHKCLSCNISFSEQLADSNFGLVKCVDCGEYIDSDGHYIDSRFVDYCEDCGIEFNSLEFNGVCPLCWRTPRLEE